MRGAAPVGPGHVVGDALAKTLALVVQSGRVLAPLGLEAQVERRHVHGAAVCGPDRTTAVADAIVPGLLPHAVRLDEEGRHQTHAVAVGEVLDMDAVERHGLTGGQPQGGQHPVGRLVGRRHRLDRPVLGVVERQDRDHQLGPVAQVGEQQLPRHAALVVLGVAKMQLCRLGQRQAGWEVLRGGVVLVDEDERGLVGDDDLVEHRPIRLLEVERAGDRPGRLHVLERP